MKKSIEGEKTRKIIKSAAAIVLTGAASLALYYVSFRLICLATSIETSGGYNSVASATVLSAPRRLPVLILNAYKNVFLYIVRPETFHRTISGCINICLLLISLVLLFLVVRKMEARRIVMIVLLVLLLPLAAYFIYLLYGNNDSLLTFPIVMLFLCAGMLFELVPKEEYRRLIKGLFRAAVLFSAALIFFGSIYSNQVYLKKNVESQQTLSLMTRVLYHMEETEGYVPGETRVAFIGNLEKSEILFRKQGYEPLAGRTMDYETSLLIYNNYRMYLYNILGYPINLVEQREAETIGQRQEVTEMPAFPHPGCTLMLEDTLVVELSDP